MKTIEERAEEYIEPFRANLLRCETDLMKQAYIAGATEALAGVTPPTSHYPHECKHCNADGVHCDKRTEIAGEYTWVYPCHILEYPCPYFTPKTSSHADKT